MNQLGVYMEETGRTADEVAVDLTAILGRKIGPEGVKLHSRRPKAPKAWAAALGLPAEEEPAAASFFEPEPGDADAAAQPLGRDEGEPPTPPQGAKVVRPPAPSGQAAVKQRLEYAYGAIGAGATLVTGNHGYEAVADHYAPNLADGWLKAAEVSPTVAKIVRFLDSGGPVGELVIGHVILILGFAYISGRGPDLAFLYGRFDGYRAAAIAEAVRREAEASLNGSGQQPEPDRVA